MNFYKKAAEIKKEDHSINLILINCWNKGIPFKKHNDIQEEYSPAVENCLELLLQYLRRDREETVT